jgi:hypothetical protein
VLPEARCHRCDRSAELRADDENEVRAQEAPDPRVEPGLDVLVRCKIDDRDVAPTNVEFGQPLERARAADDLEGLRLGRAFDCANKRGDSTARCNLIRRAPFGRR